MKVYILFLLSFISAVYAQTTLPKYAELETRIQVIDNFSAQSLPGIKNKISESQKEIGDYKNSKFISSDEIQKNNYLQQINRTKEIVENAESSLSTAPAKKLMTELDKNIKEKALYETAKVNMENLEKDPGNSNKLEKYFSLLKEGKYTNAKILFALLSSSEKSKAQDFETNYNYTIREKNTQDFLKSEIKRLKESIVKSLSYPEDAIAKIQAVVADEKSTMTQFFEFKNTIEGSIQFDYTLPSQWELGLFSCESKNNPKYLRFKNYPDLIVLDNDGGYNSIIKLSSSDPKKLNVVYHCSHMGSFGSCLENKEKKLCNLDPSCQEVLTNMEKSFDRNTFFNSVKNTMPTDILKTAKLDLQDPKKLNLISEFAKVNHLGFYTKDELYQLADQMIEKTKSIQANTPEDYYKKIKVELGNLEKSEKVRLQNKPGYSTNTAKKNESFQALAYMIATMDSSLSEIKENDTIQEFSYKACANNDGEHLEFCQLYTDFKEKSKLFGPVEVIQNFVPTECPRLVFRFQNQSTNNSTELSHCTPLVPIKDENLNNLINNVNDVLKK